MKSSRTIIHIGYNKRVEVQPGVWENRVIYTAIKAEEEQIYQSRLDKARHDGLVISKRFKVRSFYVQPNLDYVVHNGLTYKVSTIYNNIESHYASIECGELV